MKCEAEFDVGDELLALLKEVATPTLDDILIKSINEPYECLDETTEKKKAQQIYERLQNDSSDNGSDSDEINTLE